jgi:hypothetical protein
VERHVETAKTHKGLYRHRQAIVRSTYDRIYSYDKIKEMRLTQTEFWCPKLDATSICWVLLFKTLKVKGWLSFEILINVAIVTQAQTLDSTLYKVPSSRMNGAKASRRPVSSSQREHDHVSL